MHVSEEFAKVLKATLLAFGLLVLGFTLSDLVQPHEQAAAQNAGTVGIQAQLSPVFSAQATTASSGIFNDIGQGISLLYVCNSGFTGTIDLEWSPAPFATSPIYHVITQAGYTSDSACHSIVFGAYFPNIRSTVTRSAGSLSAWYSAGSGPGGFGNSAIGTNGPTAPINCDQNFATSVANSAVGILGVPFNLGDTIVICSMVVSFSAAPSGAIAVEWGVSCTSGLVGNVWQSYVSSSSANPLVVPMIQRYPVPNYYACFSNTSGATAEVSISYASVHLP